jgi:hypothetical protein
MGMLALAPRSLKGKVAPHPDFIMQHLSSPDLPLGELEDLLYPLVDLGKEGNAGSSTKRVRQVKRGLYLGLCTLLTRRRRDCATLILALLSLSGNLTLTPRCPWGCACKKACAQVIIWG